MMNVIIAEGLEDKEFVENRTTGYEELKEMVKKYPPEEAEKITGVPADLIREAALMYAKADNASLLFSMGITQHTVGTENVMSTSNLAMLTGNIGRARNRSKPIKRSKQRARSM